jgi:bifunctional non-homologous end joining protein LigD
VAGAGFREAGMAKFLVHRHATGRVHFDLHLIQNKVVRSWSLLKEPPLRTGKGRLAVERERLSVEEISRPILKEEAFGTGRARIWDRGEVTLRIVTPERLVMLFAGDKMKGRYQLRRMHWYPGNRWLLEKSGPANANLT